MTPVELMSETIDESLQEIEVPAEMLPDGEDEFTKDDMFHLLQNSRRRGVLRYLRGSEGRVRMRDVAEQVAAWENDTTVKQLSSKERQRVYIALYQRHLDSLDKEGVIDYNKSRGYVEPLPLAEKLEPYLDDPSHDEDVDDDQEAERLWPANYAGVTVIGTALFAAVQVGLVTISMDLLFVGVILMLGTLVLLDAAGVGDVAIESPKSTD